MKHEWSAENYSAGQTKGLIWPMGRGRTLPTLRLEHCLYNKSQMQNATTKDVKILTLVSMQIFCYSISHSNKKNTFIREIEEKNLPYSILIFLLLLFFDAIFLLFLDLDLGFCFFRFCKLTFCDKKYLNSRFCIIQSLLRRRSGASYLHNFLSSHILTLSAQNTH